MTKKIKSAQISKSQPSGTPKNSTNGKMKIKNRVPTMENPPPPPKKKNK